MNVYVRLDKNNFVEDWLDYPFEGYEEVEYSEGPLSILRNGWFKVENGKVVKDEEVMTAIISKNSYAGVLHDELEVLKKSNSELEEHVAFESLSNVRKEDKIKEIKEDNIRLEEQLSREMMNNLELESRLSSLEEKIERVEK